MRWPKALLRKLSARKNETVQTSVPDSAQPECPATRFELGEGFCFEFDEVPNGMGGYRMVDVYLLKTSDPSFKRCIVNKSGEIQNPLGIGSGEWEKELKIPLAGMKTQFRFWIYAYKDGKAEVEWTLQPDGRYFADEYGFGWENFDEITLYSSLDTNGFFTEAFRHR